MWAIIMMDAIMQLRSKSEKFTHIFSYQMGLLHGSFMVDGIKFSPPSPHSDGASSVVGGRVEVCLRRISRDLVGVCLWQILMSEMKSP